MFDNDFILKSRYQKICKMWLMGSSYSTRKNHTATVCIASKTSVTNDKIIHWQDAVYFIGVLPYALYDPYGFATIY